MHITGSSHIKSFTKGHSFKGLRERHLEVSDRGKKVAKRPELVGLNKKYTYGEGYNELVNKWNGMVEEYNMKPSQRRNKSRRLADIADYVDKKQSNKTANVDFNGVEFMMVSKLGNMEDWNNVVELFASHGVYEEETLACLNDGFNEFVKTFNKSFKGVLECVEMHTNLDELGAPHCHMHVCSTGVNDKGLPETNLSSMLKKVYGNKYSKEIMGLFREKVDSDLVSILGSSLCDLAQSKGFEFSGLELVRLKAKNVGLTHEKYVQEQMVKSGIKERERALEEKEKAFLKRVETFENNRAKFSEFASNKVNEAIKEKDALLSVKLQELDDLVNTAKEKVESVTKLVQSHDRLFVSGIEQRMSDFMETITYNDGTTAKQRFDRAEYERYAKKSDSEREMDTKVKEVEKVREAAKQSVEIVRVNPKGVIDFDEEVNRIAKEAKPRRVVKDLIDYSNYDKDDYGPDF